MGFGGGLYTEQNKTIPGAYYKFVTAEDNITKYTNRGIVGLITTSDWTDGNLTRLVIPELEFKYKGTMVWPRDAQKALGYDAYAQIPDTYTGEADLAKFLPVFVREVFRNATGCFIYAVNTSNGAKASSAHAEAVKSGTRGNDLSVKITKNGSDYEVVTMLDNVAMNTQTVKLASELVANDWVTFKSEPVLSETVSEALSGGKDGTVDDKEVAKAVEVLANHGVNVVLPMVTPKDSSFLDAFFAQNNKYGHWMQCIAKRGTNTVPTGGHEYITTPSVGSESVPVELLYPWIAGASAACPLNRALDNRTYDGELISFLVNKKGLVPPSQDTLENAMRAGNMMLHTVGDEWRVLNDDNTLIEYKKPKDPAYQKNQTVRVNQALANEWQAVFNNEFYGLAGTDDEDLTNYKMRITKTAMRFASQKILKNFDTKDIVVTLGEQSDSYAVYCEIQPNYCVRKVYNEIAVRAFGK